MACKLSFLRREIVREIFSLGKVLLVVFKHVGNGSGTLNPLGESMKPELTKVVSW